MTTVFLGLDPGASGGIAAITADGALLFAEPMPATDRDVLDLLAEANREHAARAVIERVHASPQMGVVSAFTFGRGVGALHMALTAAGIPYDVVTPHIWQVAMGCAPHRARAGSTALKGGFARRDKNAAKARAQVLFPGVRVTHALADALLLAEYARRTGTPGGMR